MTVEEFTVLLAERIPTAAEFVAFVEAQPGWKVRIKDDGTAALRVPDVTDPVAVRLAKVLGREPYRTNVLRLVTGRAEPDLPTEPRPDVIATPHPVDEPDRGEPAGESQPATVTPDPPPAPEPTRVEALADLFRRAGDRPVYGRDSEGHGGQLDRQGRVMPGWWSVPPDRVTLAAIAGGSWETLPTPTSVAG